MSDDWAQSMCSKRSPGSQSRRPTKSKPDAVEQAAVLAQRELAHPLEDDQLDLADLREVDERSDLLLAGPHGIGTRATTSFTTDSAVRPWLAACGPEPDAVAEHVGRQVLDVFGIDLVAAAHEQRPHLGQPAPHDDGARRGAEIDAALDQLRRRVAQPVGVGVVRPRRGDELLDVGAEAFVQEHVLVDARAHGDDPLFRHQRVEAHALEVEIDQLGLFLGRQVTDVDHDGEAVGGGFRQRERALAELDRIHGGDGEAEGRQLVGGLADRDGAVLQSLEERALRLERNAVDLVEQDDFGRGQRPELGDELAGGRVDHLEADHLGRLQVGAALDAGELARRRSPPG